MAYLVKPAKAPYQRAKKSTLQIMIELGIALAIVWVAAVITSFIKLGDVYGVQSILLMVVSLAVTALCDVITTVLKNKKDKTLGKKIVYDLVHNYSWITAMIFTLLCPVWTDYYVVIVGSIFSTLIVKNVFGGFGANVFNPAAFGRIFIQLCFNLGVPAAIKEGVIGGSTLTGVVNSTQQWLGSFPIEGYSIVDILLGNYFGTMGETFTILILVLGVILAIRGVIAWRAPAFYVGTVAVASLLIGLVLGFEDPLMYLVYHVGLGGLMFGAVFMITDPVTTPTSPVGNCFVGILAGLLTVLLRVGTNNVEGVVYSIAIVNLISPTVDTLVTAKTNEKTGLKSGVTFGTAFVSLVLCTAVAWVSNGGVEINEINGIHRSQYDKLVQYTNFEFMEENNYEFTLYKKTLPNDKALYSADSLDKAYSIIDENDKEVAVVYCVKVNDIAINNGYAIANKTAVAYVAISIEERKVIDIGFETVPFVGSNYEGKVKDGVNDYDYANNNILEAEPNTIVAGATFSSTGVKQAAQIAYDIFVSQYAE